MDTNTALLGALLIVAAGGVWRAERRHAETMRLWNDLATMVGEFWDWLEARGGKGA